MAYRIETRTSEPRFSNMVTPYISNGDWYLQGKIKFIAARVFGEKYNEDVHKTVKIIKNEGLCSKTK